MAVIQTNSRRNTPLGHAKPTQFIDLEKPLTIVNVHSQPKALSRRNFLTRTAAATAAVAVAPLAIAGTDKFGRDRDWTGNDAVTHPEPAWEVKDKRFSSRQGNATLLAFLHTPEVVANLVFGGTKRHRLFMTGSTSIYAIYVNAVGAALS